jgi:hypothetical protein
VTRNRLCTGLSTGIGDGPDDCASGLRSQASCQGLAQLAQLRRFVQNTIHVLRRAPLRNESLSPTRQHDHDRLPGRAFHRGADLAPVDVRHPEVGYHDMKRITLCALRRGVRDKLRDFFNEALRFAARAIARLARPLGLDRNTASVAR